MKNGGREQVKVKVRWNHAAGSGKGRRMPTNSSNEKRRVPTKCQEWMRRKATNALSLFVAFSCLVSGCVFPADFGRGWCLEKIKAFKFQKAVRITFG
jgi:hypothetical protein